MVALLVDKGTAGWQERLDGLHDIYVAMQTPSDCAS